MFLREEPAVLRSSAHGVAIFTIIVFFQTRKILIHVGFILFLSQYRSIGESLLQAYLEGGDQLEVSAAVPQLSCETFVVHPGISRIIGRWPVDGKLFQESPIKGDGYLGISLEKH